MKNTENQIYDILEDYAIGIDTYEWDTDEVIVNFLTEKNLEFKHIVSMWPNMEGYCAFFSWIENGKLYAIAFDVKFNEKEIF